MIYLIHSRTFVNAIMYSHPTQQKIHESRMHIFFWIPWYTSFIDIFLCKKHHALYILKIVCIGASTEFLFLFLLFEIFFGHFWRFSLSNDFKVFIFYDVYYWNIPGNALNSLIHMPYLRKVLKYDIPPHMCVCIYIYIYTHIYVCIYTYTHTYIYVRTCIHKMDV
jgi:hypothetical protein